MDTFLQKDRRTGKDRRSGTERRAFRDHLYGGHERRVYLERRRQNERRKWVRLFCHLPPIIETLNLPWHYTLFHSKKGSHKPGPSVDLTRLPEEFMLSRNE
ncbi:MAG: hypothetical protein PVG99_09250 [Desulfobacteraceae bacterium]